MLSWPLGPVRSKPLLSERMRHAAIGAVCRPHKYPVVICYFRRCSYVATNFMHIAHCNKGLCFSGIEINRNLVCKIFDRGYRHV